MSRIDRISDRLRRRPARTVFVALAAVPLCLAGLSFRQPFGVPAPVAGVLEVAFRLFVYAPVAGIRTWLYEPLGVDALFAVSGLEQTAVFATLLGFYYLLSRVLVRVGGRVRDCLESRGDARRF